MRFMCGIKFAIALLWILTTQAQAITLDYMLDGTRIVLLNSECKAIPQFKRYVRVTVDKRIIEQGCWTTLNGHYIMQPLGKRYLIYYPITI